MESLSAESRLNFFWFDETSKSNIHPLIFSADKKAFQTAFDFPI